MKKLLFAIPLAAALALVACGTKPEAAEPQSIARISVQGNKFVNADGDTVTFRGLCLADEPGAHIPVMATDEYGEHITKLLLSAKHPIIYKIGLIPFAGVSPLVYLCFCYKTKIVNHGQRYTFFRTAAVWTADKIT